MTSEIERVLRAGLGLGLACLGQVLPAQAEPSITVVPLPFAVSEFRGPASRVAAVAPSLAPLRSDKAAADRPMVVVWGQGGSAALTVAGRDIGVRALASGGADLALIERGRDTIPQSRVETVGPITVSLTEPTRDYRHAALGASPHAKTITVAERKPVQAGAGAQAVPLEITKVPAGPGAVFEDREPRLTQVAGDITPEIVTVKSYADRGSALAVVAKRDGAWRVIAETPPIGEPQRWLNPAAVADFQGTGQTQIALVRTPHLDGILQVWALIGDRLELRTEKAGYANHAYGETAQDLAAVADIDGDGRPELILPVLDRQSLAILSLKDGIREISRIALPARVTSGVAVLGAGRDLHLLAGLENGQVVDIRP